MVLPAPTMPFDETPFHEPANDYGGAKHVCSNIHLSSMFLAPPDKGLKGAVTLAQNKATIGKKNRIYIFMV
jgi:hypothetical protein